MGDSRDDSKAIQLPLEVEPVTPRGRGLLWTVAATIVAAAALLGAPVPGLSLVARLLGFAAVLGVGVVVSLARSARERRTSRRHGPTVVLDSRGIRRLGSDGEAAVIARWDEAFGLTVLTNPSRTRAVLAFTSAERTRLIPVIDRDASDSRDSRWLDRAVTVTDADLDDALHGRSYGCLSGRSAARLFAEIETRAAPAIDRLYLFDASGAKVSLERDKLGAHDKVIDLAEPVEWRSFTFHEAPALMSAPGGATGAAAVTVYQATWIRQGSTEIVLVCPIPADASSLGLGRSSNHPPAREIRVAVDRLFMLPLRKAVEGAPRISRAGAPPKRSSHAIPSS
jgi:hypothetical protein